MNSILRRRRALMGRKQSAPILPDGYQLIEYFRTKGTSTSVIDLLVNPKNTRRLDIDAKVNSNISAVNTCILGAVQSDKYWQITTNTDSQYFIFQAGSTYAESNVLADNNRHIFVLDAKNGLCWVDNNPPVQLPVGADLTIDIWSGKRSGDKARVSDITVFSFKVYENDVLIRHFYPCYEKNTNMNKLFDIVQQQVFDFGGSNDVIRGPDV